MEIFSNPVGLLSLVAMVLIIAFAIHWYRRELNGDNYHAKYPRAKLLDDAAKQGKLVPGSTEAISQRLGAASDVNAEIAAMRSEMELGEAS